VSSGDDIQRVIDEHVRSDQAIGPVRRISRDRLNRLMAVLGRGPEPDRATDEALALLSLLGVDEEIRRELSLSAEQAKALGIEFREAFPIVQAYSRAAARIVDAEASLARQLLRQRPEAERAQYLERLLTLLLPLGVRGFEVIHAALFHATLLDELAPDQLEEHDGAPMWVALVDLCGSTRYLASARAGEAEQLVDALFEAGQTCVQGRQVRVVKYVGDGIFLVGRDPTDVARASFDALDQIAATLPLPARAGVAHGPLLRRSGDYFGLAVNLAQLLTKVARQGTVLATREAAADFPRELRGRGRRVRIRGWDQQLEVVTLRRPDGAP
jgi:class 3 adenylate cyclase